MHGSSQSTLVANPKIGNRMCLGCAGIASNGSALRRSVADSVRRQPPVSRSWPFDLPGSGKDIAKDKPDARIRTKRRGRFKSHDEDRRNPRLGLGPVAAVGLPLLISPYRNRGKANRIARKIATVPENTYQRFCPRLRPPFLQRFSCLFDLNMHALPNARLLERGTQRLGLKGVARTPKPISFA